MNLFILIGFFLSTFISGAILCRYYEKEYQLTRIQQVLILGGGLLLSAIWLVFNQKIVDVYWLYGMLFGIMPLLLFIDYKFQDLPDFLNLLIAGLGLIHLFYVAEPGTHLLTGVGLFFGFWLLAILTGALGGGDIKFGGAIGLWFLPSLILLFLEVSFFSGGLVAAYLIWVKKQPKDAFFCFGPFLILGALAVLF